MKATARPSPSAISHALVPYPPRERPSASRSSRPLLLAPFFPRPPPCGEPGCWCHRETSSRVEPHALGPGAAAAPRRPGGPSGGRSEPPATRAPGQPGWRATWPRSDGARQWPKSCAADPEAGSYPWGGMSRSAAPVSSSARPLAWLLLIQEGQNAIPVRRFKVEQALIPPGAPCRGPQTEPDGGKKPEKKRLTEKAPYKSEDQVQVRPTRLKRLSQSWLSRSRLNDRSAIP